MVVCLSEDAKWNESGRAYPRSVLLLAQVEHRNRALQSAPTRAGPLKNTQTVSVTRSQSGVG